jgi:adenosylcobinamide-GDP ribazoletransferase
VTPGGGVRDAVRLALGTLTVLPVPPPSRVDRAVAGTAMALAPVVGAALGLLGGVVVLAVLVAEPDAPAVAAVLGVGAVAGCTRLLHWDGLADTADGLGSGHRAGAALEVMRRSDIGPFGVVAVVGVLAVQVTAVADLAAERALGGLVVGATLGRAALLAGCRAGVPPARAEGLGSGVAGSVTAGPLLVGAGLTAALVGGTVVLDGSLPWPAAAAATLAAAGWSGAATAYLRRRLGGMTGDTLGALVETTTALALVVLALW